MQTTTYRAVDDGSYRNPNDGVIFAKSFIGKQILGGNFSLPTIPKNVNFLCNYYFVDENKFNKKCEKKRISMGPQKNLLYERAHECYVLVNKVCSN